MNTFEVQADCDQTTGVQVILQCLVVGPRTQALVPESYPL